MASKADIQELLRLQVKALRDIFNNEGEENLGKQYLLNSIMFYCLLFVNSDTVDGESLPSELSYLVKKQSFDETVELAEVLGALIDVAGSILQDKRQQQAVDVIKAVLHNGLSKLVRAVLDKDHSSRSVLESLLPVER